MKIEKLIDIKTCLDSLIKLQKSIKKMLDHESAMDFNNTTPKRRSAMRHAIDSACEERNRYEHELHCLIVEAGLAAAYPDEHYGSRVEHPNAWHEVKKEYRRPNI